MDAEQRLALVQDSLTPARRTIPRASPACRHPASHETRSGGWTTTCPAQFSLPAFGGLGAREFYESSVSCAYTRTSALVPRGPWAKAQMK